MLQNARVTAFIVSELFRENKQRGVGGKITPLPTPSLGLKGNVANKPISKGVYKSNIWVTSRDFEYSYSLIHMAPFVTPDRKETYNRDRDFDKYKLFLPGFSH